jgi:hypothetical protein
VTYELRLFQRVRDELSEDVVVVVQNALDLVRNPFLDHRHVDLGHVHLAVELGRELCGAQQLFVDIGDECGRHVAGLRMFVSALVGTKSKSKRGECLAEVVWQVWSENK